MKYSVIIGFFLTFLITSCSKNSNDDNNTCNCAAPNPVCATIVKVAANCNSFGIESKGVQYPSLTIPAQFQVEGTKVCVQYTLYNDLRTCPCCGGTWADITSIALAN